MTDPWEWVRIIGGGFVGFLSLVAAGAVGLLSKRLSGLDLEIKSAYQERAALRASHAAHKLHAAETYVSKRELNQLEARLTKHMDNGFTDLKSRISELRSPGGR